MHEESRMTQSLELRVNTRTVTGKKVAALRRQGITPINLYGGVIESQSIQANTADLRRILGSVGMTHLLNLQIDGKEGLKNVMVRNIEVDAITGQLVHVSLYQVQMGEDVTVDVPVKLVGEAPAAKATGNSIAQELNTLTISSLPGEMPSSIEVDITSLSGQDQAIRVKDIKPIKGIVIQNDPETVVVRVATATVEHKEEKPKSEPVPEELK